MGCFDYFATVVEDVKRHGDSESILWSRLKSFGKKVKHEIAVYRLVLRHKRTPRLAKVLLGMTVGYALLPFDLIPDFVPVLGYLDDAIIIPMLILPALWIIPKDVIEECRGQVQAATPDR